MPQVPIAQVPAYQQSGDSYYIRQSAANGRYYNWLQAGASMSHGLRQVGGVIQELYQKKKLADDFDNASQIKLLVAQEKFNVQQRMRENEKDYESFEKWNEEALNGLTGKIRPYMGKLSQDALREMQPYLEGESLGMRQFTRSIQFQADLTVKKDNIIARSEYNCKMGNYEAAREEVRNGLASGLLSEAMAYSMNKKIDNDKDFWDGKRQIDAGDLGVIDQLKQRTDSGEYANFKNLTLENRDKLVEHAEHVKDRKFTNDVKVFAATVEQGTCPTVAEVDQSYKQGKVDERTYLAQKAFAERYWQQSRQEDLESFTADAMEGQYPELKHLEEMREAGVITDKEYISRRRIVEAIETEKQNKSIRQSQAKQRESIRQSQAIFCAELESVSVPVSPQKQMTFRAEQYEKALGVAAGDVEVFNRLRAQIDKRIDGQDPFKKDEKGELVKDMIDQMAKAGDFAYRGDENEAMQAERKLQFYTAGRQMLQDGKGISEIKKEIDGLNQAWQEKRIAQLFNNSGRLKQSATNGKSFDSRKMYAEALAPYENSWLEPSPYVYQEVHHKVQKLKKDGWIDAADIIDQQKGESGRMVWTLKDGRKVYADEYINE